MDEARRYGEILHLPFPVLADPERQVYHRYGLEKYLHLVQRTASVVIDRGGMIRYLKFAVNPMTWLKESHELIDFVKTLKNESSG